MSCQLAVFVALAEGLRARSELEVYLIGEIPVYFAEGEIDKIVREAIVDGEIVDRDGILELTQEGRAALADSAFLKFVAQRIHFALPPRIPEEVKPPSDSRRHERLTKFMRRPRRPKP